MRYSLSSPEVVDRDPRHEEPGRGRHERRLLRRPSLPRRPARRSSPSTAGQGTTTNDRRHPESASNCCSPTRSARRSPPDRGLSAARQHRVPQPPPARRARRPQRPRRLHRGRPAAGGLVLPTLYQSASAEGTPTTRGPSWPRPRPRSPSSSSRPLPGSRISASRPPCCSPATSRAEQLALIDTLAEQWNRTGHDLRVIALSVNRAATQLAPDHAGVFETTLLSALWPDRVHLDQIPLPADAPAPDPVDSVDYDHRHDPGHPLWGVMGPDPRQYRPEQAHLLLDEIVTWTCQQVDNASS